MFISVLQTALQSLIFFALHFSQGGSFPPPLSRKEEEECITRAANGDMDARNKLISHNLRLVAYIVKKHYADSREQDDLISIGIIGLIKAAETFNNDRCISFSTYAGKCINNQIRMYFRKIKHQQSEVYMFDTMDSDKDGNAITMADIFSDGTDVASEAVLNVDLERMYKFIEEELTEREKEILAKRYGLSGTSYKVERIMTQREVADELNISRSYVSRIEKKALEKLRARFDKGK